MIRLTKTVMAISNHDLIQAEIQEFLCLLFNPGQVFEIRAIGRSGVSFGYFNDPVKAAEKIKITDGIGTFSGIYVTLNPVNTSLLARRADRIERAGKGDATTGDSDIESRQWLLIDCDPIRPSGISATDDEILFAETQINLVAMLLEELGFTEPIYSDSGNGRHLLYKIDLPNNQDSTNLIKGILGTLDHLYSTDHCKIDTSVFNSSRISKIYGTVSRKGDNTEDRPHRRSRIISRPEKIEPVPLEALKNVASMLKLDDKPDKKKSHSFEVSKFLDKWGLTYKITGNGDEVVYSLDKCPFSDAHTDGAYVSQNKASGAIKAACHHDSCGAGKNRWKELRSKFEDDYDPDKKFKSSASSKKKSAFGEEEEEEEPKRHLPYFEKSGKLYLTCISVDDRYSYAHLEGNKVLFSPEETDIKGVLTVPPHLPIHQDRGEMIYIVGIPRSDILTNSPLLTPSQIYTRIRDHFYKYFDAPEIEYELFIYYCLYTWFFTKCGTTPYLRFLGDTGKGKSRFLKVIADLCFLTLKAAGSSSLSGLMRKKEQWMGTLLIDENDLKGDQCDPLVKYLNLGFEKDNFFLLTDKSDVSKCHVFDPFGPKIIAMRQPFRDNATEGRCLSFSPSETTREDIPPELPARYFDEVDELRALICRFTLEHWQDVSEESMLNCNGMGLEGRLKQMARPLSIVLSIFPDGEKRFKEYLLTRQKEIKQTRAESWEGGMFNYALQLATMEEDLMIDPEFGKYYYGGRIQAVIPKMISEALKVSPKSVTRALEGIGMEVRPKRVTIAKKDGATSKTVRALFVSNKQKWREITQRYYFCEDGGTNIPECPSCLKGPEFNTIQTGISTTQPDSLPVPSTSVTSVTSVTEDPITRSNSDQTVTDVTHVTDYKDTPSPQQVTEDSRSESLPVPSTSVTSVTSVTEDDDNSDATPLKEWLSYQGIPHDVTPKKYVQIPASRRNGQYCICHCGDPADYWIPGILYKQICSRHLDEFKDRYAKEQHQEEEL